MIRTLPAPLAIPWRWAALYLPLVYVGALAVMLLRRPEAITRPQLYAEEGVIFYLPTFTEDWWSLLIEPWAGYLNLYPRLAAMASRAVEPPLAPIVGTLLTFALIAGVAAFLVSDRMSSILPSRPARLAVAGMMLLFPGAWDVIGFTITAQWYLNVYLVALAVALPPWSRIGHVFDGIGAVLAALSGPVVLFVAPLFWIWRRGWLAGVVTACGVIQAGIIVVSSAERPFQVPSLPLIVEVAALRTNVAILGPRLGSAAPDWLAPLLAAALVVILVRALPVRAWAFVYVSLVVAGAGLAAFGPELAWWVLGAHERYFLLAFVTAALLVAGGIASHDRIARPLGVALAVLIVVGSLPELRLQPHPDSGWVEQSRCLGGAAPCVVEVFPGGEWDLHWIHSMRK